MALSQVQCLDDNHVSCPLQESTPEFLYSEDQRLALEALIHGGRKAFQEYIQDHSVRQFLSELEQKRLAGSAVSYPPESEDERAEDGEDAAGSLQYWPERSDSSIPELDIGWPDRVSYRGVTRVSVYTQPPMDGETHIKEIVRKTISKAQKVIGVVMDLFTDVDIFKDLLDASFRRKVAVYIILEATGVPHFLTMCKRANMHRGHLKNLRVRNAGGTVLRTHSHGTVCGLLSQKFMFVDGDKAVSGSYSYTWMASRLDRNLITVLTGEVVETFDKQFRQLYLESEGVNLNNIGLEAEPAPKPAPQLVAMPTPAVRKTVVNPKYALVNTNTNTKGNKDSTDPQKAVEGLTGQSSTRSCASASAPARALQRPGVAVEGDPIHPALRGLEYADMMHYLPTWPEPDPPADVTEDCTDPAQDHLMSAKHLETSRLIQSTGTPKEPAKELKHLRGTNGLSSTRGQGQQRGAEEGTSISMALEERHENLKTADCLGSPDSPPVEKEAKDISSNSAMSTQQNRNLQTTDSPSTTQEQGIKKETKESRIFEISEEHHKNLQTTNGLSTTDARVIDTAEKGESKICKASNESHQNLKTANGPKTRDAVVVEREEVVLNIPKMSKEQKHRTANGPTTKGTPRVQEEDEGVSDTSAKPGHHKNTQATTPDSACNGLVQSEVQCQADERDAARASRPVLAQHLQELTHPHNAVRVVPVDTKRQQEWRQTRGQEQKDSWKVIRTLPRALGGDIHFQQEVHTWGAGTRLNGNIHPPNLAGTNMRQQQSFWQGNDLTQRRPGQGSNPQSFQKPPQLRDQSPFHGRTAPTRLGIQTSHAPRWQHQGGPRAQQVRGRPATRGPLTHWPSEPQVDRSGALGPQYTGPSQLRAVNRTALGLGPAAYRGWNS
ncbi:hypothetical protein GJAV_G00225950 [Gymnothorax javanicus]|nr:hypothetical protein GJAV_G00225950 [Gymnothorax javanicus]